MLLLLRPVTGLTGVVDIVSTGTVNNFSRTIIAQARQVGTPEFTPLIYSVALTSWKEKEL